MYTLISSKQLFFIALAYCIASMVIGCGEQSNNLVSPDPDSGAIVSYGTAAIHNPTDTRLDLVDGTQLLSPDGRLYKIVGQIHVHAYGTTTVTISTEHAHFDLPEGFRLSIESLSRTKFRKAFAITRENTDPNRNAFG